MWLLIDDTRDLGADVTARTADAGKLMLRMVRWEFVCLDHDLGDPFGATGYDVLVWAIDNGFLPPKVQLVTSNPVGRKRMADALMYTGYVSVDGFNFVKE